ncbi:hypothetical protein IQ06DRAFT_53163 [Phaeosphaeriaceae sp. SRC1lsM3a]|nr:hypothetical protein IQ06DRAFT_53163 [Stagonospora sp. SRC1lsM3a]
MERCEHEERTEVCRQSVEASKARRSWSENIDCAVECTMTPDRVEAGVWRCRCVWRMDGGVTTAICIPGHASEAIAGNAPLAYRSIRYYDVAVHLAVKPVSSARLTARGQVRATGPRRHVRWRAIGIDHDCELKRGGQRRTCIHGSLPAESRTASCCFFSTLARLRMLISRIAGTRPSAEGSRRWRLTGAGHRIAPTAHPRARSLQRRGAVHAPAVCATAAQIVDSSTSPGEDNGASSSSAPVQQGFCSAPIANRAVRCSASWA